MKMNERLAASQPERVPGFPKIDLAELAEACEFAIEKTKRPSSLPGEASTFAAWNEIFTVDNLGLIVGSEKVIFARIGLRFVDDLLKFVAEYKNTELSKKFALDVVQVENRLALFLTEASAQVPKEKLAEVFRAYLARKK